MRSVDKIEPRNFAPGFGAYSQGIKVPLLGADLIFVSGQVAMDENGNIVAPGDAQKQTECIFENIKKVLAEAGASMADVVKAQIFVTDINDVPQVSAVRNRYFDQTRPVSTLVEVGRLVKEEFCVEIEVIAVRLTDQE